MMPWFVWKNQNSVTNGLWINKLPPIVRAQERLQEITVPGREGVLTLTEGEDVYEPVIKKCVIIARNQMDLQSILEWLRGSGEVVFSNEPRFKYFARIAAEVSFGRISNDLSQATVVFACNPFKGHLNTDQDALTVTTSETLYNPGNVASRPVVSVTGTGSNVSVTIAGNTMVFNSLNGTIKVDCDAKIVTQDGSLWAGTYTGEFWKIPKGEAQVSQSGGTSVTIDPNWRWV